MGKKDARENDALTVVAEVVLLSLLRDELCNLGLGDKLWTSLQDVTEDIFPRGGQSANRQDTETEDCQLDLKPEETDSGQDSNNRALSTEGTHAEAAVTKEDASRQRECQTDNGQDIETEDCQMSALSTVGTHAEAAVTKEDASRQRECQTDNGQDIETEDCQMS